MIEKELVKLIDDAKDLRERAAKNGAADYNADVFDDLSNFILKRLNNLVFKNQNAKIIANYFDEILPLIVMTNIDILLLHAHLLIEQPNFKGKFIEGLKKYPYRDGIEQIFYHIWASLNYEKNEFNDFIDTDILNVISSLDVNIVFYTDMLNRLGEDKQKELLILLVENKRDIPYSTIEFKGNNKQIIFDNIDLFIENAQNLYSLMDFVKDNPVALAKVKDFISNHEDRAMESIFCETEHQVKIEDPTIKELIRLMITDVMRNENTDFSDITYNGGGFSRIILVGDKVIKIGNRATKTFPNNPYIVAPLLRQEFKSLNETCFAEVTERVDTSNPPSKEELYQLFKNLRNLGLVWTDIVDVNAGRLKRKNVIHWNDDLDPSEEVLGLGARRGTEVLKEGDLVVLDADFIFDENDPNIIYTNHKPLFDEFEERYQSEKKGIFR